VTGKEMYEERFSKMLMKMMVLMRVRIQLWMWGMKQTHRLATSCIRRKKCTLYTRMFIRAANIFGLWVQIMKSGGVVRYYSTII
jgi:hypothetical protein